MPDVATEEGVLEFSDLVWTNGKANTVISTNSKLKIQYQINEIEEENWITAEIGGQEIEVENLNNNG